ncbi:MAG: threonine/serine dehydratase [Alphaproteobacteria bacterium]
MDHSPTFEDVLKAKERIDGHAVLTPLLHSPSLSKRLGCTLYVKPEVLQHIGAFKFRGAYNKISQLDEAARKRGVVGYSSGNHAQGVAAAAALLGAPATIVMPSDAPAIKIANTKALGATVVLYDRARESREEIGQRITAEKGATLVKPYDDGDVIAGQGTAGLELMRQLEERGKRPDIVVVPCGGGGLIAGCSIAIKAINPATSIYSAEPMGLDDTARSLAFGERVSNNPKATSICDALLAPTPGEITFPINKKNLAGGLVVTDAEVLRAIRAAFLDLKLVVEPGGAVALAAVLEGKVDCKGKTVAVVLSGGNVDPAVFERALKAT